MGLREQFREIIGYQYERWERENKGEKEKEVCVEKLLAAVCEEIDHDFTCFVGGKQVCQTCGEPYPFAAKLPLPTAEDVKGILKNER